ncbi:MAG TPA: metalloregulator ArsR/SmtB family transcription factor [Chthonomonadales bacterium]|nr:metalloregulator ArsR/SmtB family transcription factor [Chthonomonadales bacterium]
MHVNKSDITQLAAMFKALGDPTRLRIFEFLRSCSEAVEVGETGEVRHTRGPTAGQVCCCITGSERINSTISHHLKELRLAGLICVERRGKHMICSANQEAVALLADYLRGAGDRPCCRE